MTRNDADQKQRKGRQPLCHQSFEKATNSGHQDHQPKRNEDLGKALKQLERFIINRRTLGGMVAGCQVDQPSPLVGGDQP